MCALAIVNHAWLQCDAASVLCSNCRQSNWRHHTFIYSWWLIQWNIELIHDILIYITESGCLMAFGKHVSILFWSLRHTRLSLASYSTTQSPFLHSAVTFGCIHSCDVEILKPWFPFSFFLFLFFFKFNIFYFLYTLKRTCHKDKIVTIFLASSF